ncbi:MAG TPA: NAD(P)/FAD-dependent oxidoreductase [Solirubrobacterales bacterium]
MSGSDDRFDVVIVGARCAGSPLATMLAGRGLRVCLLDRSEFPSDTLSTHVIQPCGVSILRRLGLLDGVIAAGAVTLTQFTLVNEDVRVEARVDPKDLGAPAICIRRVSFDHLLVEAAASAGAEVRAGTAVTGLLTEAGRVAGVETTEGSIRASLVVGADGRSSTVAGLVGAAEYYVMPPHRLFSWAYFEGAADTGGNLRLGQKGELAFLATPTDAGLFLAGPCPFMEARDTFLADREGEFMAGLRRWPELAEIVAGAKRVGPIRVAANWHGYLREAVGPGWALVGDAGHFKDPTPAQGISDAFRQASRLADAVEAGLGGGASIDAELGRWWQWRDRDAYAMFQLATDMGAPSSPLLGLEVLREIADDEEATLKLLRVLNHELRPSGLFTPRLIGRAIGGAVRNRPRQAPALMREVASELRKEARHVRLRQQKRGKKRQVAGRR